MPLPRPATVIPSEDEQRRAVYQLFLDMAERDEQEQATASLPTWTPQPGPQALAWDIVHRCDEVLYGGEPGGGKSSLEVALGLKFMGFPRARILVLRRNTSHLNELIDEARDIYMRGNTSGRFAFRPACPDNTRFREDKGWLLVNGDRLRVWFGHCDDPKSWEIYHGQAFDVVCFDEVTQFHEEAYNEIRSRIRGKTPGVPRFSFATANPPKPSEPGAKWVRNRWGPWLDRNWKMPDWELTDTAGNVVRGKGLPDRGREPADSGQILYVMRINGVEMFSTEPFSWDGDRAQTRTFIRARLSDNKALMEADPGYRAKLRDNDPVRAKQLLEGDWMVTYEKGGMFNRATFCPVQEVPPGAVSWVRAWDFAGTEAKNKKDPDWTIALKLGRHENGLFYITHVFRMRGEPGDVEATRDALARSDGPAVKQLYPKDPAEAGKTVALLRVAAAIDAGVSADTVPSTKSKFENARMVSAAAHPRALGREEGYGKICYVPGDWADAFFDVLENFPLPNRHDDDVDALANAYNDLMTQERWIPVVAPSVVVPQLRMAGRRGFG